MAYELIIDNVLLTAAQFSKPSGVRVGYRGPVLADREFGQMSVTVFHKLPQDQTPSYLRTDAVIELRKDGIRIYRGVITRVEKKDFVTDVQTKETGGRLSDLEAGIPFVNGLPNPNLYVYLLESETSLLFADPPIAVFLIQHEDTLDRPLEFTDRERVMLFDSYHYQAYTYPYIPHWPAELRAQIHKEESLQTVAERVMHLANAQQAGLIASVDVQISGQRTQSSLTIRDEEDELLSSEWVQGSLSYWPLGMETRTVDGVTATYAWIQRAFDIQLYQLINHSRAKYLGHIPLVQNMAGYGDPLHNGTAFDRYGPFVVPMLNLFPHILSFYQIAGTLENGARRQRAFIHEVDLRMARNIDPQGQVNHRRWFIETTAAGATWERYVYMNGPGKYYTVEKSTLPTRRFNSERTGGEYHCGANNQGSLRWRGDIFLSEVAFDFRAVSLRDVLHDLAMVTGCEWWIDESGVLRVQRIDRMPYTANVTGRLMEEIVIEETSEDPIENLSLSGIELNQQCERLIVQEINQQVLNQQLPRKQIRFVPDTPQSFTLGARTKFNGEWEGRLVAVEPGDDVVTLELEGN